MKKVDKIKTLKT